MGGRSPRKGDTQLEMRISVAVPEPGQSQGTDVSEIKPGAVLLKLMWCGGDARDVLFSRSSTSC